MSDLRPNSHLSPGNSLLSPGNSRISYEQPHSKSTLEPNTQYVPRIVQSGYIVGPPIAYTNSPSLPPQYAPFSAISTSRVDRTPSPHRATTPSKIVQAPPVYFNRPSTPTRVQQVPVINSPVMQVSYRQDSVPRAQYERCVSQCKNWQTKYNQLYLKYMNKWQQGNQQEVQRLKEDNFRLRQKLREAENKDLSQLTPAVKDMIEQYKESTLKEVYLLLDRYRLECKKNQR